MNLARILTLHPEDATNLIQQLRRMGFDVEVADPNQEHADPADLEIEFAVCDQQQVLARAGAIANQLQAEVVVFPGAIPPLPRPIPIMQQPVSDFSNQEEPRAEEPVETPAAHENGPERQGGRELPELGQEAISGLKRVRAGMSSVLASMGSRASEYRERMRLRGAERRAAREQRRAELVRQAAAREQERLKQEEIAAAARQQEFQRLQTEREERRAEMERLRVEAEEQAAQHQARLEAEEQRRQQAAQLPGKQPRTWAVRQTSQLRGVFTGAIAAAILFAVGMLLANFSPTTPLPAGATKGSVEQEIPFGPTTLHGAPASAGVTVGGMSAPKPLHGSNNVARPAIPAQTKPQPSGAKAPAPKKSQGRRLRSSNRNRDDGTADDVVVRHFGPQQQAQPHPQQAGLKRYSDMQ